MIPPPKVNTAKIRKSLNTIFDDPILDAFCQDYFPDVYDRFSRGMQKGEKITLLLDHCRRLSDGFEALRRAIYSEYEASDLQRGELKTLIEAMGSSPNESPITEDNSAKPEKKTLKTVSKPETASKGDEMKDFFVSYNGKDKTWAEWIAWQLEEAGYTTVIQAWDFRPGGNFVIDMQKAAAGAKRTIAVLSENYLSALYTQPEWAAAFKQDPTGEEKTLLPVRVAECKVKGMLAPIVYIDLVGKSETEAQQALLEGVKVGRVKPATAPGFPGSSPVVSHTQSEKPSFPPKEKDSKTQADQSITAPTPPSLPRFKQIKLKTLEERLETLTKQYEAANRQLNSTLAAADKVTIEQQIKSLEQEIQAVEDEINQLKGSA